MNIRQKVLVAPVIAGVFLVLLGVLALTALRQEHRALDSIYTERFKHFATASAEFKAIYRIHANTYRVFTWLANLSEAQISSATKEIVASVEKTSAAMKKLASNPALLPEERTALSTTIKSLQTYSKQVGDALDMASMDPNVGMASMQTADETFRKLDTDFEKLVTLETKLSQQEYDRAVKHSQQTIFISGVLLVIALTAAVAVSLIMARRIVSPVSQLRSTIVGIQQSNDLTRRAPVVDNDEIGQMATAFNHLLESFKSIIHQVTDNATEVSSWAHKVSDAAEDISEGAANQSAATSMVAATVEEMTVSIHEVSRHADQARTVTEESEDISAKGAKTISAAFEEIRKISGAVNKSSQTLQELDNEVEKISEIVNVIKDVAEQTNLLALNAAIEAARAGEQGRGFAVVADEVKKLAQHTSASTKEIASMIAKVQATAGAAVAGMNEGVSLVDSGVRLAGDALDSIQMIKAKSDKVVSTVGDISYAITEQSNAMHSMAESIERIASMTDRTGSATAATSESAKRLLALADNMLNGVKRFSA